MNVNDKIKELMNERKMSVYNLSQLSGITQSTLATMFSRGTPPKIDTLYEICKVFNITLAQFFMENETNEIVTEQEKNMLDKYRTLSPEKQKAFLEIIAK